MSTLSAPQIRTLYYKTHELLIEKVLIPPLSSEKETSYTQRVILPLISEWVKSLNEAGLHVRGDGGLNPLPIVWDGIALYPDVTIMNFLERLMSFEVKFLRIEDPGGSLTKAIGQTLMYEKAGFATSIGIIVDCRKLQDSHTGLRVSESFQLSENSVALIFKPFNN